MSEQMIPIGSIDDPEFNSRLSADPSALKSLAESMPTPDKLINAVTVEQVGDRYLLVTGSRRLAAARMNGWTEIRADVRPKSDEVTRIVQNFVENNQRYDLSLYEQARAISKMKDAGATGPDIAAATGYSKQKISNLIGMYTRLPPAIHEKWRAGHKAATFEFLQGLAVMKAKTPEALAEAQVEAWGDRAALFDKFDDKLDPKENVRGNGKADKEEKTKAEPNDPPFKVPAQRYYDIYRAVQKAKLPKVVLEVMKALVGETNKVKTVWDPAIGTQSVQ